jgi:hypothetical protein
MMKESAVTVVREGDKTLAQLDDLARLEGVGDAAVSVVMAKEELAVREKLSVVEKIVDDLNMRVLDLKNEISKEVESYALELLSEPFDEAWEQIQVLMHEDSSVRHFGDKTKINSTCFTGKDGRAASASTEQLDLVFRASIRLNLRDLDGDHLYVNVEVQVAEDADLVSIWSKQLDVWELQDTCNNKAKELRKLKDYMKDAPFRRRQAQACVDEQKIQKAAPDLIGALEELNKRQQLALADITGGN